MLPSSCETNNWKKRLSALEGMMAQVVVVIHKNLGAQVVAKETIKSEELPMVLNDAK
jgi:succinate dehydrogenase hydrophobic anchor subunit